MSENPIKTVKEIQKKVLEARSFIGRNAGWLFVVVVEKDYEQEAFDACLNAVLSGADVNYDMFPEINAVLIHDPWLDSLDVAADFEACLRSKCIHYKKFRVVLW